ncbi:MAG: 30S ribosomal protein S2 [Candidatus Omnitrophica bacterium]|nr:30S ribosomal protein S2 [Candidatus Omnitrophota bacterium]
MVETNDLLKKLLEAGVHFGHQTRRWNPRMKPYIFGSRNGIHIIDLQKTVMAVEEARKFLLELTASGGRVLFVGTKKQARDIIMRKAQESEMFYVNERWLGGALTNFKTIRQSVSRLKEIASFKANGTFDTLKKKERAHLIKEEEKLRRNLSGIVDMEELPDCLYVIDTKCEEIAVKEARKLGIPIVGIVDTNCDPEDISFPIPGNDDAFKSISFLTDLLCEAMIEGRTQYKKSAPKEKKERKAKIETPAESPKHGDEDDAGHATDQTPHDMSGEVEASGETLSQDAA